MKIIVDSAIPFLRGLLEPYAQVEYYAGREITSAVVHDASALIVRTRTRCDAALLEGSTVEMIATATIGFDHIDTAWCAAHNIRIATAAGCNARGVLQWVAAALAHLSRTQNWAPDQRTLGIVGVGHVGSLIEKYATAWGFKVLCCDPPREALEHRGFLSLEDVASQADILTFHVPLDATTHHMADSRLLSLLKPRATLLNSSRGEVVATAALSRSKIDFALDVWEQEPLPNTALITQALISTPHIAGYSLQGKANAAAMSVRSLSKHFGLPLTEWYPTGVTPSNPQNISWDQMCDSMCNNFDINALSDALKSHPEQFETMRDNYCYRAEYF